MKIGSTRTDYKLKKKLIIKNNNPIDTFDYWYKNAAKLVAEPNAFCLSTINNKSPESRMMLLKDYDDGFTFFTNILSNKGIELMENKNCSMNFWWKEIHQQVRISGICKLIKTDSTKEYFYSRPKGSQIAAYLSNQSKRIASYETLIKKYKKIIKKYDNKKVPYPKSWVGFNVQPIKIEFWQGAEFRLHQRVEFIKERNKWKKKLLAP
ncbi:pyridoxamine 5'-phosphate oxidase [bacterium]|nr:pyridoxamine 5'-phosphate oxidase [bacterium]